MDNFMVNSFGGTHTKSPIKSFNPNSHLNPLNRAFDIPALHQTQNNIKQIESPVLFVLLNDETSTKLPVLKDLISENPSIKLKDPNLNSNFKYTIIGSGRDFTSDLARIKSAIADGNFYDNRELIDAVNHVKIMKKKGFDSKLNLLGIAKAPEGKNYPAHIKALKTLAIKNGLDESDIKYNFVDNVAEAKDYVSPTDSLVLFNLQAQKSKALAEKFLKLDQSQPDFRLTSLVDPEIETPINIALQRRPFIGGIVQVLDNLGLGIKKIGEEGKAHLMNRSLNGETDRHFNNVDSALVPSGSNNLKLIGQETLKSLDSKKHALTIVDLPTSDQEEFSLNESLARIIEKAKSTSTKLLLLAGDQLIMHDPNKKVSFTNTDSEKNVGLKNIAATILDALKIPVPEYMGKSLLTEVSEAESSSNENPFRLFYAQQAVNAMKKFQRQLMPTPS